ncbi:MAG: Fic family protein [Acidimicrobiaceae bacterium]|nr:Fic family protein [Acidimicrobiaceae bacterium]
MGSWPAAQSKIVTVPNELWRNWDEESTPTIDVAQTSPPEIASISVPALDDAAADAIVGALKATAQLHARSDRTPGVLGHLSAVLIRADAVASSQIEHITTSAEQLAVKLADLSDGDAGAYTTDTELVAANVEAALSAHRSGNAVSTDWFHRLHRELLAADPEIEPRHRGRWRDGAVWVGRTRAVAEFEGPPHGQVPALMDDLVRFARRVDVHPVLHAAVAHAQFLTIHPYVDGNGRIGRLLIHKLLPAGGAPVPVAHGLLSDPVRYVSGLTSYRSGDLDAWVGVFADAVTVAARVASRLVGRLDDLRSDYHGRVRTRSGSSVPQVIDMLLDNPAVTAQSIQDRFGVTSARAGQILHRLADAGILRPSPYKAGRSKVWIAPEVIDAVDVINALVSRRPLPEAATTAPYT